jgi:hypothetical protein
MNQIFQVMRIWRYSPFNFPKIYLFLPILKIYSKVGPKTPLGLMTTMSKPFSFTKSHIAFLQMYWTTQTNLAPATCYFINFPKSIKFLALQEKIKSKVKMLRKTQ